MYNKNNVASVIASSLSPLSGILAYQNVVSATTSLNMGGVLQSGLSTFEVRHIVPDIAIQTSVAPEADSIMKQNFGIVQALENTMNFSSKFNSLGGMEISERLDWLQNSGLVAALERNNMYQSQIAQAVEALQVPIKDALNNQHVMDNLSEVVMGLSGVVKNAMLNHHSIIADICKIMPSHMTLWDGEIQVDQKILCSAADRVLARTEEWTLDSASEAIAKEYDFEVDKKNKNTQTNITESRDDSEALLPQTRKLDAEKVRDWILAIISIIDFILGIYLASGAINISVNNSFNTVHETNNYYTYECGADAKLLNGCYYRIINRETVVRLKHDCHSFVTGNLKTGQVIIVRNKYKKWLQIEWEDADGNTCLGWVQNYKVTEFEHSKEEMKSD